MRIRRKLRAIRSSWREDIWPWWRTPGKKPFVAQVREIFAAWRAYGRFPKQYFRYRAYLTSVDDPLGYLPQRLIAKAQKALSPRAGGHLTRDKQRFRAEMEAAGLPAVRELFTVGPEGAITDAAGAALTRPEAEDRIAAHGGDLFVKPVDGAFGIDAHVLAAGADTGTLFDGRTWIVQPRLVQHPVLAQIYPDAINTVRIDTLATGDNVEIGCAILRMGFGGSVVDNGRAGGLAAAIDAASGRICRPAMREPLFDPARSSFDRHPDTGVQILGVELPFWPDLRVLVTAAARSFLHLRTIGWDVVLGPDGPVLLEANARWDADLMQLHWPMRDTPLGRVAVAQLHGGGAPR